MDSNHTSLGINGRYHALGVGKIRSLMRATNMAAARIRLCFISLATIVLVHLNAQQPKVHTLNVGNKKGAVDFSFVHITDIHIGEGETDRDYGTEGFFDTLAGNEHGYPATRLSSAVRWINQYAQQQKLNFVILSGDITDSGEKSEFFHAKQLMDSLQIPYFPLMGNHDAWPYNTFCKEAPTACGDSLMNEIFATTFSSLNKTFTLRSSTQYIPWWNNESNSNAHLQNFHYSHKGYSFIFLDFNPRYHVQKAEPGIGPEAQLMHGTGGTFEFLQSALTEAKSLNEKVIIITHHPPISALIGFHYAFTASEKTQLAKALRPYKKMILGWFAGHIHRHANYYFTKAAMIKVFETKANKAQPYGGFRLVNIKR